MSRLLSLRFNTCIVYGSNIRTNNLSEEGGQTCIFASRSSCNSLRSWSAINPDGHPPNPTTC
jgi:hypothetical protein